MGALSRYELSCRLQAADAPRGRIVSTSVSVGGWPSFMGAPVAHGSRGVLCTWTTQVWKSSEERMSC